MSIIFFIVAASPVTYCLLYFVLGPVSLRHPSQKAQSVLIGQLISGVGILSFKLFQTTHRHFVNMFLGDVMKKRKRKLDGKQDISTCFRAFCLRF